MSLDLSDEQKADIATHKEAFLNEYTELTKKHEVDFAGRIIKTPIGTGIWADSVFMDLMDKRYLPTPSDPTKII